MSYVINSLLMLSFALSMFGRADESDFVTETKAWQQHREDKLRGENGWLTLVGRYPLKDGINTLGVGQSNNIVLPSTLKEIGPDQLGSIIVNSLAGTATLRLADSVSMQSDGKEFQGERTFDILSEKRDWVSLGRMSMHVIAREGKFFLRVADNQSEQRTKFPGCTWYSPQASWRVDAKYVSYAEEKTLVINNVLGERLEQPCCGYAEFVMDGVKYQLDAIREGEGLFFVFRDATAGESTYGGGRFIDIEKRPDNGARFILDFNRAYNPPCAFSKYTTCPLPPPQNVLKIRIEAGETFIPRP
jgi:uncharacterized protein (DUF1684 family)